MKLYLAGPMSGLPEFNFPAFNAAAERLRAAGHKVVNPADNAGGDTSKPWAYYMRKDIRHVLTVEAVAVLPGWENSRGATLEVTIARALELPVYWAESVTADGILEPLAEPRELHGSILLEAQRLVYGARQESYGHPAEDYGRTSAMWSAILGVPVSPKQAALCMCAVKISREVNAPSRDNLVDLAGYAAVAARIDARAAGSE